MFETMVEAEDSEKSSKKAENQKTSPSPEDCEMGQTTLDTWVQNHTILPYGGRRHSPISIPKGPPTYEAWLQNL